MRQQYLEEQAREIAKRTSGDYEKILKASKKYWEDKCVIASRSIEGVLYVLEAEKVTERINRRWFTKRFLKEILEYVMDMDYVTEVINDLIVIATDELYREKHLERLERRRMKRNAI